MKITFLSLTLLLGGCSNCDVPYGDYHSYGGTESLTTLSLEHGSFSLVKEQWKPADYENRTHVREQGVWSCQGGHVSLKTNNGDVTASLQEIGENPLGLPPITKALVFSTVESHLLSNEILYYHVK